MTDRELFEKLKRDREFWHVPDDNIDNPDFSTPDGFFWLWERAQEKEWWNQFKFALLSLNNPPYCEIVDRFAYNINPTRFTEALKEYLSGR